MSEPRAYTADEVRDMILDHVRAMARYWAEIPDYDNATGREYTIHDRCEGVAFSILAMLDGCSMTLPAFDLVPDPHPDDEEFLRAEGSNWFDRSVRVSTMLHEYFHEKPK